MALSSLPKLAAVIESVGTVQKAYAKTHGRYWQGKRTKADSEAAIVGMDSWADMGLDLAGVNEEIEVHTHDGPDGIGYTIRLHKTEDGKEYLKTIGHGSHSDTFDWILVPPK